MIINLSRIDFGGVTGGGNAKPEEVFDVQPTTADQTITPTEGSVFSGGTVRAVTSSIDNNIVPENIKEGVSILGVAGTLSGGSGGSANLVPLTVEASNENRTFNPSDLGADGFNSVNANGYDVDGLYNIFDDIYNNDTGADPTVIAEWKSGKAHIHIPSYNIDATTDSPVTTADIQFDSINWTKNDEVTQITINNAENLTSYSFMFASTPNLQSITANLGHKEDIDMSGMFMGSGITNIMNLGLETCKPSNLMSFVQNTKFTQIPMMDTTGCMIFDDMLSESNIKTLPAYSYASVKGKFYWGKAPALTTVEGLVDLGRSFSEPNTVDMSADYNPALEKQSAWNIVNTVYDFVANNGAGNGSTLNFSGFNWVWDEGEQANLITTANAKGWNITF